MSNELEVKKPPFKFTPKPTGLAARKALAQEQSKASGIPVEKQPHEMEHRIGIVFDDSGSMAGQPIKDAHEGIEEFLRSCEKDKTAVAIYPLNAAKLDLSSNLPAVAIMVKSIKDSGGTPLVGKTKQMLYEQPLTRAIVFSDGSPTDYYDDSRNPCKNYLLVVEKGIPVDTVYIPDGSCDLRASAFMKKLAEDSGGIYLQLERGKSNFRTAFKYLSPGLRYMLADKSFVAKLEGK